MTAPAAGEARFWDLAEAVLTGPGVERSTMMGLPCLRVHGAFFASGDRRTGDLLIELPEARVDQLVAVGRAHAFAPAGRRFREWAAIPLDHRPTRPLAGPPSNDENRVRPAGVRGQRLRRSPRLPIDPTCSVDRRQALQRPPRAGTVKLAAEALLRRRHSPHSRTSKRLLGEALALVDSGR